MNISTAAVALLAALPAAALAQECISHGFKIEFDDACTPETVINAYDDQIFRASGGTASTCAISAQADLEAKLAAAGMTLDSLCKQAYDTQDKVPFTDAAGRGKNLHFEKMFYNGRTDWQEEVETVYETDDMTRTNILKEDAEQVKVFFEGTAQGHRVEWPGSLPNFQSSVKDANDLETCTTNAAMCCWPKDRQANDNNGNCAKEYDVNCVDKDVADNTDLCFVDLERSNYTDEEGFVGFPEDNGNGEGAIHCHGFAWSNDANDMTARYKANNLFFVSMYDHMYQRGYVENIPGAPMCGCVEQMPTVTRSDCTQVDLKETIKISFDGSTFMSKITAVHVDFNACQGINNRNNDLWAYLGRLYYQGDITPKQFGEAGRIITNTNCDEATRFHLDGKGMTRGYDHETSTWSKVAGRDDLYSDPPYPRDAFKKAFFQGSLTAPPDLNVTEFNIGEQPIMMRICATCTDTHKKIFYRRKTPITDPNFDLLQSILFHRGDGNGQNKWGEDFSLHSTYQDAVTGNNEWECINDAFNYNAPFDGECSPTGAKIRNQFSIWNWYPGPRNDVAYYINKPEYEGIQELDLSTSQRYYNVQTDIDIGLVSIPGRTFEAVDGALHISGSGNDIWHQADMGHYLSEPRMGDVDVKVHVTSFTGIANKYAKAGIMLRADNSDDANHIFAMLSGNSGVYLAVRGSKHSHTYVAADYKTNPVQKSAWLRLLKRMDTVEFYRSDDGVDWIFVKSVEIRFPENTYRTGLAVTSAHNGYASEAVFEDYTIEDYNFPSSAPSISNAPTSWEPDSTIGGAKAGLYQLDADNVSAFLAYGTGMWDSADSFFFRNAKKGLEGAFEVRTYVNEFHTGYVSGKGGVMIRDNDSPDSAHAFLGMSGNYAGVTFQSRASTGAKTVHHQTIFVPHAKAWIKLSKPAGSGAITAYYKINIDDEWIEIGTTLVSLTEKSLLVGTAVTSADPNGYHGVWLKTKDFQVVDKPSGKKVLRK